MGAAPQADPGRARGQGQGREQGLQDQGDRTGCAHIEEVIPRPHPPGSKGDPAGIDGHPFHLGAADRLQRLNGGQVLGPEAGFRTIGPDILNSNRQAQQRGQA